MVQLTEHVFIDATLVPQSFEQCLADAMPLTAELEELIDKTICEIQELESQDLGAWELCGHHGTIGHSL